MECPTYRLYFLGVHTLLKKLFCKPRRKCNCFVGYSMVYGTSKQEIKNEPLLSAYIVSSNIKSSLLAISFSNNKCSTEIIFYFSLEVNVDEIK